MIPGWQVACTAVVLAAWILGPIAAIVLPPRRHDPQRDQAVGCLLIAAVLGLIAAVVFAAGVVFGISWLVRPIAWFATFVLGLLALNGVRYLLELVKQRSRRG